MGCSCGKPSAVEDSTVSARDRPLVLPLATVGPVHADAPAKRSAATLVVPSRREEKVGVRMNAESMMVQKKAGSGPIRANWPDAERRRAAERSAQRSHPMQMFGSLPKAVEGEQVAAGWPAWLAAVAGEAIRGWVPRRADSFEKLDKVNAKIEEYNKVDDAGAYNMEEVDNLPQEAPHKFSVSSGITECSTADPAIEIAARDFCSGVPNHTFRSVQNVPQATKRPKPQRKKVSANSGVTEFSTVDPATEVTPEEVSVDFGETVKYAHNVPRSTQRPNSRPEEFSTVDPATEIIPEEVSMDSGETVKYAQNVPWSTQRPKSRPEEVSVEKAKYAQNVPRSRSHLEEVSVDFGENSHGCGTDHGVTRGNPETSDLAHRPRFDVHNPPHYVHPFEEDPKEPNKVIIRRSQRTSHPPDHFVGVVSPLAIHTEMIQPKGAKDQPPSGPTPEGHRNHVSNTAQERATTAVTQPTTSKFCCFVAVCSERV